MRKFKFFAIGLIPGLILVFFILNKKGASCTGYLPNSRVIAETLSKKMVYSEAFSAEMKLQNISEKVLRDSIMKYGEINFEKSNAQKEPCPIYILTYPKKGPKYELSFEKCEEEALYKSLEKLR